jgi:hypothetical protein
MLKRGPGFLPTPGKGQPLRDDVIDSITSNDLDELYTDEPSQGSGVGVPPGRNPFSPHGGNQFGAPGMNPFGIAPFPPSIFGGFFEGGQGPFQGPQTPFGPPAFGSPNNEVMY